MNCVVLGRTQTLGRQTVWPLDNTVGPFGSLLNIRTALRNRFRRCETQWRWIWKPLAREWCYSISVNSKQKAVKSNVYCEETLWFFPDFFEMEVQVSPTLITYSLRAFFIFKKWIGAAKSNHLHTLDTGFPGYCDWKIAQINWSADWLAINIQQRWRNCIRQNSSVSEKAFHTLLFTWMKSKANDYVKVAGTNFFGESFI